MKDPLEYLNDVKIDLSEYENIQLNDIEKRKIKKMVRKSLDKNREVKKPLKLATKVSGVVAGITVCTLTFGLCFPTYAQKIPILKDVYERIFSTPDLGNYEEVSVPVMAKTKVGKYELSIEKAYYNGIELTIIYKVTGDEPIRKGSQYVLEEYVTTDDNIVENSSLFYGEFIDDYTFQGTISRQFKVEHNGELPTVFNGSLKVIKLHTGKLETDYIDINLDEIPLTLDSSDIDVKDYEINKSIIIGERTIEVLNAKEYPTGMFINFKYPPVKTEMFRDYYLLDSNKGILREKSVNPNSEESTVLMQHSPASEDGEVYLIPYKYDENSSGRKVLITLEKGKFDFGTQGTLEILDIKDVDDKTELKVRCTGLFAAYNLYFEGEGEMEYYRPIYKKDVKNLNILESEKTFIFEKLDRNKNYYIYDSQNNYEILYDQMIKIK